MKQTNKMYSLILSAGVFLGVLPVLPVYAEESAAPVEDVVAATATITLNETAAAAEGDHVTIDGTKITISASGSYVFSGKLTDGQIIVNVADITADPGTVKLFFNGVNITGNTAPPVYVVNAENTSINLMDGTENFLYDGGTYSADTNAVVYAKDDITIKSGGTVGDGKLLIDASYQHGLHCNNDVKITGGDIRVKTISSDGIRGKKSVEIKGGKLDVNAGGDGVKSTKGDVFVSGGDTEIKAGNDAVQGETTVQISNGSLKANGDRGITNAAGEILITGGVVFATATKDELKEGQTEADIKDNRFKVSAESTQPVILLNAKEQIVKDQRVELKASGTETAVFSKNPNKKFDYVLISSPDLVVGSKYNLYIGGSQAEPSEFTVAEGISTVDNVVNQTPVIVPEIDPMDINGDGTVDVSDAVLLARFVAEDATAKITADGVKRADVNGDGKRNGDDIIVILRRIAHLD